MSLSPPPPSPENACSYACNLMSLSKMNFTGLVDINIAKYLYNIIMIKI